MFVEIIRLFIVFLATAAGFSLARGGGADPNASAILGATLGACVGYVAGGILGRLIRLAMGTVEASIEQAPPGQLLAGVAGAAALGLLSALISLPALFLLPVRMGWPVMGMIVWVGMYEGYTIASHKAEDLLALAGLSTRPLVRASPYGRSGDLDAALVDTSAILDGRLLAVARAGFLRCSLLIPRFVLDELQTIADAQEPGKRRKGQRGLDLLRAVKQEATVDIHILDDEVVEHEEVDAKLVSLALRLKVSLLTVDMNLQRVAELQGVRCLNLHRLADGLRPVLVPGEVIRLPISREGKEPGQGVGFLDDGTMVVVGDAAEMIGQEIPVRVTGNVQTSVGRMLFASLAAE
ncbi:MAG: hypothetical protein QOG03_407 [Actinomycetota bacterium]|jgi:uncharacterized protein YacL|nr:hypothetical protein [Actinomycetota bacterium]